MSERESNEGRYDHLFLEITQFLDRSRQGSLEPPKRPTHLISEFEEKIWMPLGYGLSISMGVMAYGMFDNNWDLATVASYAVAVTFTDFFAIGFHGILNSVRFRRS